RATAGSSNACSTGMFSKPPLEQEAPSSKIPIDIKNSIRIFRIPYFLSRTRISCLIPIYTLSVLIKAYPYACIGDTDQIKVCTAGLVDIIPLRFEQQTKGTADGRVVIPAGTQPLTADVIMEYHPSIVFDAGV